MRALTGMKGTRPTTAKSSPGKAKIPKPRHPSVTPIDHFSMAGMAKLKKASAGRKVKSARKSPTMKVTTHRAPKRRRKKTIG